MAKHKFGSHVVDKLWINGTEDERKVIREELFRFRGQLKGNMYGRIVLRNCGMESSQIQSKSKGREQMSQTKTLESAGEEIVTVQKQKKKRRADEPSKNDIEEVEGGKKFKKDFPSSYNEELFQLGVGIKDEEWKNSKAQEKVRMNSCQIVFSLFS